MEDVSNFDWDYFWQSYFFSTQGVSSLFESYRQIAKNEDGDIFVVVSSNASTFEVYINYLTQETVSGVVLKTVVSNLSDKDELSRLQQAIRTTKLPILNVNFRDSDHNTTLTGKQGNHSFSVINGVKDSIVQSVYDRLGQLPDVLYFHINKLEPRKLEFFKHVFAEVFPNFKNQYTDFSYPRYDLVYFF